MTTILIKKKDTAGAPAPGDLTNAAGGTEIAVNTATRRIYTKDSGGNVVELGNNATSSTIADLTVTNSTTLSYGTANQVQYLNASKLLVGSANMVFNGTTLSVTDFTDSSLTAGRVTFAGTGGNLNDSASLTWDGAILTSSGFAGPLNGTVGATTANTGNFTTLTTSSTVTLNGGTANGVAYLNGSKVLTTGSALTFNGSDFGVSASVATATLASSGAYSALSFTNSGGAGASGTILTNSSGILQSRAATHAYTNADASSEYMRLNSTGLGVGIAPSSKLTVNGAISVIDNYALNLGSNQGGGATILYNGNGNLDITPRSTFSTVFTAGNVGIGTDSPNSKLEVNSSGASVTAALALSNYQGGADGYGSKISFRGQRGAPNAQVEYGYIQAAMYDWAGTPNMQMGIMGGKVGIGTTTPTQILHVSGGTIRGDLGASGTSLIVTGTGSNLQVGHTSANYVTLLNSGGALLLQSSNASSFGVIQYPSQAANRAVRWVITNGDSGSNTVQVYWNAVYGAGSAGGCLGAYDRSGNYAAPGTVISGSNEWSIYGFASYVL